MIQTTNLYFGRYIEPRRGSDDIAVLTRSFSVIHDGVTITVPRGFGTDGSSVPRLARAIVDRMTGIEASVVHDFLYRTQAQPKAFADDLFDAMLYENPYVSWLERKLMVGAVKVFGGPSFYKTVDPFVNDDEEIDHG